MVNYISKKISIIYLIFIFLVSFYLRNNFGSIKLTSITLLLCFAFFPAFFIKDKNFNFLFKIFNSSFLILVFLVYFVITQSSLLNYETIDWDVNSYLVSSNDISRGNLPYETQWESKSPLFYYVYYFVSWISDNNLLNFKLLNDFLILIICFVMYLTIKKIFQNKKNNYLFPLFFYISLLNMPWAHAEYSEYYCLFFIVLSNYFFVGQNNPKYFIQLSALFLSFASLLNVGTSVFLIPYLYYFYFKKTKLRVLLSFLFVFSLPHLFFLILYISQDLFLTYLASVFFIPLSYSQTNFSFINEFMVFLRSIAEFSFFLYPILILLFLSILIKTFQKSIGSYKLGNEDSMYFLYLLLTLSSLAYFFFAAKGYNHHMLFFLYYASFITVFFNNQYVFKLKKIFLSLTIFTLVLVNYQSSLNNLSNIRSLDNNYPLKQLSAKIASYHDSDYSVLALEHVLVLYYLQKPNHTYIIHPLNHQETFITENLIKIGRISRNEISRVAVPSQPDVIICSENFLEFNCEITDNYKNYVEIDTTSYLNSNNLTYYRNPYQKMRVFIKK